MAIIAITTNSSIRVKPRFVLKVRNADLQIEIGVLTRTKLSHNLTRAKGKKGVIGTDGQREIQVEPAR